MQIFHNPRCSKSRESLQILQRKGIEPEIVLYLEEKITQKRLKEVLKKLNIDASELVRKGEPLYKEKFSDQKYSEAEWLQILSKNPKLIERPIFINGELAVIGRPAEKVLEIL